jgi:hypothetical protein
MYHRQQMHLHFIVYCNRDYSCFNLRGHCKRAEIKLDCGWCVVPSGKLITEYPLIRAALIFFECLVYFQDLFYQQNYS